jgi:hypothetical protein
LRERMETRDDRDRRDARPDERERRDDRRDDRRDERNGRDRARTPPPVTAIAGDDGRDVANGKMNGDGGRTPPYDDRRD